MNSQDESLDTRRGCAPVSYTHLDVYKRQPGDNPILGIAVAFGGRFSAVKVYHGANFRLVRASPAKVVVLSLIHI